MLLYDISRKYKNIARGPVFFCDQNVRDRRGGRDRWVSARVIGRVVAACRIGRVGELALREPGPVPSDLVSPVEAAVVLPNVTTGRERAARLDADGRPGNSRIGHYGQNGPADRSVAHEGVREVRRGGHHRCELRLIVPRLRRWQVCRSQPAPAP